jgi:hypothetical protein
MILKHYGALMVALVVLTFIVMTAAAREYINYTTIQANIDHQLEQQAYRSEKIAFEQNFLIPYLQSSSALFFYQHENSVLGPNEYVIHLDTPVSDTEPTVTVARTEEIQLARQLFFVRVWDYIKHH